MKKAKKIKIEFLKDLKKPEEKEKKESEELENSELALEELVQSPKAKQIIEISPNLKLEEATLENQVANAPQTKETNNLNTNQPYQTITQYNSQQQGQNYQDSSYQSINFTPPPSSLSANPSLEQDFSRNPLSGFRQANPFETQGYPKTSEKNYESSNIDSSNTNEKRRRRRM